jgi:hypothetical protein
MYCELRSLQILIYETQMKHDILKGYQHFLRGRKQIFGSLRSSKILLVGRMYSVFKVRKWVIEQIY